ncbi:MAG: DUF192 domain-containing protein [Spirochaetaceae bacterium]|nr:DUF192 domain-containing protein [Spirochaetaceae bacterium]
MRKIILLLLCAFLCLSCSVKKLETENLTIQTKTGKELVVLAEIAIKPKDLEKGFMERKKIPEGTGMLFVFESDRIAHFWMKNTPTPLSIAYIDSRGTIKDIFDMTPFSLASVSSTAYVRYALEVPQGWFKKNGIAVGDTISLPKINN